MQYPLQAVEHHRRIRPHSSDANLSKTAVKTEEALYSGARIDLIVITTLVLNTAFIGEVLVLVGTVSLEWWDFIENWFNEYRVQGVPTTVSFWTTHTVSLTTMPSTANQGSI